MRYSRLAACVFGAVGVAAWAATYHLAIGDSDRHFLTALYLFDAGLITFYISSLEVNSHWSRRRIATGRVVAIVPAFEEEPELLRAALDALLRQTYPVTEIHVMDDGSAKAPVRPFPHPKIRWHRQPNGGKRCAQAGVLQTLRRQDWDFILTVDSDSVPGDDALEHLMRAMSKRRVMAATGLILTRNFADNWITRISDLNIGTSCLMIRSSRSVLGAVETTSGALALYRAHVVFDNLADYVSSGTNGDDRRLTMYALLRGDVVVVNDAVVHSAMPDSLGGLFKQRLRWGKSSWQALPFAVINLEWKKLLFPLLAVTQWIMLPVLLTMTASGVFFHTAPEYVAIAFGSYLAIRYAETAQYMIRRPHMHWTTKLLTWLWATPVELIVKVAVIYPAKYWAVAKLRDRGWVTRGNAHAGPTLPAPRPAPDATQQLPPVAKLLDPHADNETTLQLALRRR
ncbi:MULTISPECIES: glycosyltransferase family 2 protein [Streptomyces]|uniref:Glycosyltransferase family 2 protein n=1 Tax=Streptomyces doudnae TaxID=3075536 RepID=A0ABD5ELV8_9ACTN|nr:MULTISPECIES: glycosyltransferase family 2 protein [unclassified Streptomyces]MDT0435646.1 glycosyltransferase family 2 protein [Streptomyces sp. DSM 41981]MYQ62600.1 glycosyltransferase [Streptomyces sp. SID4950]SCD40596.1 hyaluronan synthase [Streptomyces sp. SolWspMP-5a-2]